MKAVLEFNLPDEANEHRAAVNAMDTLNKLREIDQHLRDFIKYGTPLPDADQGAQTACDRVVRWVRGRLATMIYEDV